MLKYFIIINEQDFVEECVSSMNDFLSLEEVDSLQKIFKDRTNENKLLQIDLLWLQPDKENLPRSIVRKVNFPNFKFLSSYRIPNRRPPQGSAPIKTEIKITMLPDISREITIRFFKTEDDYFFIKFEPSFKLPQGTAGELLISKGIYNRNSFEKPLYFRADGFFGLIKFLNLELDNAQKNFSEILKPIAAVVNYIRPLLELEPDIMQFHSIIIDINITQFIKYSKLSRLSSTKLVQLIESAGYKFKGQVVKSVNNKVESRYDRFIKV